MLPFIRSDLDDIRAYKAHPGSTNSAPVTSTIDRLDTNENPYDLPSDIRQKLAWTYQEILENNRYPDGTHEHLKAAIAKYVSESAATNITTDNISVGNGSDEIIRSILIATCAGKEGTVLVANPTFSMYAVLAQALGIPVVTVERSLVDFSLDIAAANKAIAQTTNPPIRVVFVVHPNSPTGNALTSQELSWLRSLPEHILVVVDEAYFEFSQNTVLGELSKRPNWIVLRTFSKAFRLAAHRVGYAIGHIDAIAALEKIRLPYNIPSFSLAAALIVLQNRQQLLNVVPQILDEKAKLTQALTQQPELQFWESAANFIFVRLNPSFGLAEEQLSHIHAQLMSNGTLVRYVSGGLRITVGSPQENHRTIERLQTALKNYR
ncbi:histidinol-phosphate transaminase [Aliterella atlantica]|uniref:Histidinol-phosphate aminotransferase n=1 Tax=Aliterella atlantica CENA595 TaxID=1618023 RepID=A0A0D8ZXH8_9CYAN|nr:histidinol-phosphate transaminase [Aliterella atlantica]KJH73473.1 histidinol-phosphate aminotransferase [Aliterella atlantica CENA595]